MSSPLDTTAHFQLDQAAVHYPDTVALQATELTIRRGEVVGLVGPSGAGKSTLLALLQGSLRPTAGRVWVNGRWLGSLGRRELRQFRVSVGFIHQQLALVPQLRVIQNVVAGGLGRQSLLGAARTLLWPRRDVTERVYDLLDRVGIPEKLYQRTDQLSGGQQQRVAIARALYQEPRALLADEPISSVDPARARATMQLLCEVAREHQLTLCVSLHNFALAREFLPRLIGIRSGRVVFDRHTEQLDEAEVHELYRLDEQEILAG